jgi:hypothetical protein
MDYQNFPQPIDWGVVSLLSFDEQAKAMDEQSLTIHNLKFTISMPCPSCKTTQPITFGCRHILGRDTDNHEGFTITHSKQYVCKTCIKLIERKKFKFATEIGTLCRVCCERLQVELSQRNPELVVDLFSKKQY